MESIIPPETRKLIESKLYRYKDIKHRIEDWQLSVIYPENKQSVPSAGYISNPTANKAIKLADPPTYILELIKWLELIEQTQEFCKQRGNKVFEIWYDKPKQSVSKARIKAGIKGPNTLRNMRDKAVQYLFIRALESGLCTLNVNDEKRR
jgi:hypothetical protein